MLAKKRRQPHHAARYRNRPLQPSRPPVAAIAARQAEQHSVHHAAVLGYN